MCQRKNLARPKPTNDTRLFESNTQNLYCEPSILDPPPLSTNNQKTMTRCLNDSPPTLECAPRLLRAGLPSPLSGMTFRQGASNRGPSRTLTSPSRYGHLHSPVLLFGQDSLGKASMTPEESRARTVAIISDALDLMKKNEDLFSK